MSTTIWIDGLLVSALAAARSVRLDVAPLAVFAGDGCGEVAVFAVGPGTSGVWITSRLDAAGQPVAWSTVHAMASPFWAGWRPLWIDRGRYRELFRQRLSDDGVDPSGAASLAQAVDRYADDMFPGWADDPTEVDTDLTDLYEIVRALAFARRVQDGCAGRRLGDLVAGDGGSGRIRAFRFPLGDAASDSCGMISRVDRPFGRIHPYAVLSGHTPYVRVVRPGPARPLSYRIAGVAFSLSLPAGSAVVLSTIVGAIIATGHLHLLVIRTGMVGMGIVVLMVLASLFRIGFSSEEPASEKVEAGTWRWFLLQDVGPDRRVVDAMWQADSPAEVMESKEYATLACALSEAHEHALRIGHDVVAGDVLTLAETRLGTPAEAEAVAAELRHLVSRLRAVPDPAPLEPTDVPADTPPGDGPAAGRAQTIVEMAIKTLDPDDAGASAG